jgi:hypothetical protein
MLLTCFTGDFGRGGFYFLPKNVTLQGGPGDSFAALRGDPQVSHFLQDGAPCHTSMKVKDFLTFSALSRSEKVSMFTSSMRFWVQRMSSLLNLMMKGWSMRLKEIEEDSGAHPRFVLAGHRGCCGQGDIHRNCGSGVNQ